MNQLMLKVEKVSYTYETKKVLHEVNFSLNKGEIGSLIGASGSGKTTLFRLLTGLIQPDEGLISINHQLPPEAHHSVACMMQEDLLLPWRTIIKNLTLLTELGKKNAHSASQEEAYSLMKEMGLHAYADYFPHQLSGGMRQRISLARALLQKRPLLLLDEPFGSLDVSLREQMYSLLRDFQKKNETTLLLITHDFRDALMLSDRIFILGTGKICQEWRVTDEIRDNPQASNALLKKMRKKIIELSQRESEVNL